MKAEAFLDQVAHDRTLREELAAADLAAVVAAGAREGFQFTEGELREALARRAGSGELSENALAGVAGGASSINEKALGAALGERLGRSVREALPDPPPTPPEMKGGR